MNLEQLEAEVIRLKDIEEIKNLQHRYAYFLSMAKTDQLLSLFSDDARLELADSGVYQGKKEIVKFFREVVHTHNPGAVAPGYTVQLDGSPLCWTEMLCANPIIEVAGIGASGIWFILGMFTYHFPQGPMAVWLGGRWEVEYKKENGEWKISALQFILNFRTPYEDGWARTPAIGGYKQRKHGLSL